MKVLYEKFNIVKSESIAKKKEIKKKKNVKSHETLSPYIINDVPSNR